MAYGLSAGDQSTAEGATVAVLPIWPNFGHRIQRS
jgi:hypothetical protein